MFKNLIVLITLFMCAQLFSADVLLKAGANNSWFANEGGISETKPAFGIGVHFPLNKSNKIKLGVDALYVGQKLNLEDKSWQADPFRDCGATFGDLFFHYHYFKLPIYISTSMYQSRNISIHPSIGLGINLLLVSRSSGGNRHYEEYICDFDYSQSMAGDKPLLTKNVLIGFDCIYKSIGLSFFYSYSLNKTKHMYSLKIQDYVHSMRMMLIWYIKQ